MQTDTTKTWVMITRYHKDIYGEQYSFVLRYESALTALSVCNLWKQKFSEEEDFKIFLNEIILWKNLEIVDICELSFQTLEERANEEATRLNGTKDLNAPKHLCD